MRHPTLLNQGDDQLNVHQEVANKVDADMIYSELFNNISIITILSCLPWLG